MLLNSDGIKREVHNRYSFEDFVSYLAGSIIMYKGMPVSVDIEDMESGVVELRDISTREYLFSVNPVDENMDIQSPEIGYFNYCFSTSDGSQQMKAAYSYRTPGRNFKQGLTPSNTLVVHVDGDMSYDSRCIFSEGFKESLQGKFPSFRECMRVMNSKGDIDYRSVAISKDLAVMKRDSGVTLLFYKTQEIGFIDLDNKINVPNTQIGWIIERDLSKVDWKISEI